MILYSTGGDTISPQTSSDGMVSAWRVSMLRLNAPHGERTPSEDMCERVNYLKEKAGVANVRGCYLWRSST